MKGTAPLLRIEQLVKRFGEQTVLDGIDLEICHGEILGLAGGSGSGKSVLMRTVLGLERADAGHIWLHGTDVTTASRDELGRLQRAWGVLFQGGALFSNLTVLENIEQPMLEHLDLPRELRRELAELKLHLVGLTVQTGDKFPAELSGGMVKRAGLARALALEPEVLILDEPTGGLDPISAAAFDRLVVHLQRTLALSVVMITHDLQSLSAICDRVAVLIDGKAIVGTVAELHEHPHPWIQAYFRSRPLALAVPGSMNRGA
jgi:phospholipid/cholesterol/gamma-HCH transport system ATP-binding protein